MATISSLNRTTTFFDNFTTTSPGSETKIYSPEEICESEILRQQLVEQGGPEFLSEDECLDFFYPDLNKTSRMVLFYFLAFIIPLGILLNLLSGAVFFRSKLRKLATALYFIALACTDNTVLFAELMNWLNTKESRKSTVTGLSFIQEVMPLCKFIQFLRYFGWLLSAWLVVIICIERYIAIAFPLRMSCSLTKRNSKFIIPATALVCLVLASPTLIFLGSVQTEGTPSCRVHFHYSLSHRAWLIAVRIVGELVIPSVLVSIFTSIIIFKLVRAKQLRSALTGGQQDNYFGFNETVALVAVAIAFLTLRTPYFIVYTYYLFTGDDSGGSLQARDVSYIPAILNYAINFFLYMVTTKTFRTELKGIFTWK